MDHKHNIKNNKFSDNFLIILPKALRNLSVCDIISVL